LHPSRRHDIPSGRPTVQSIIHPDDENFPPGPSFMSRNFELLQLASVRTFQQYVRTPLSVQLAMRFLSKIQICEDRCNSSDDVNSRPDALIIRQVAHSKFRRPDASPHVPDARATYMEIACIRSTVRTIIPMVRTGKALIWKLRAVKVRPSGRQGNTVQTRLNSGKNFSEILENR
jgi:hypothetical protein